MIPNGLYSIVQNIQCALYMQCTKRTPLKLLSHLTQTSRLPTPRPTKLQPRRVCHLHYFMPHILALQPKQRLRHRLPASPKAPQHNLQLLNLRVDPSILHPRHNITRQLKCRIIMLPRTFPEPDVPTRDRDQGRPSRVRERDVGVVSRGVDVEVVRFGILALRLYPHKATI